MIPVTPILTDRPSELATDISSRLNAAIREHLLSAFAPDSTKTLRHFPAPEAAELLGVSGQFMRKLHSEGTVPEPAEQRSGRRYYSAGEIRDSGENTEFELFLESRPFGFTFVEVTSEPQEPPLDTSGSSGNSTTEFTVTVLAHVSVNPHGGGVMDGPGVTGVDEVGLLVRSGAPGAGGGPPPPPPPPPPGVIVPPSIISATIFVTVGGGNGIQIRMDGSASTFVSLNHEVVFLELNATGEGTARLITLRDGETVCDPLKIWNMALGLVGGAKLRDMNDQSRERELIDGVWCQVYRDFLMSGSFRKVTTTRRLEPYVVLEEGEPLPTRWRSAYVPPADMLKPLSLNGYPWGPNEYTRFEPATIWNGAQYDEVLYTNDIRAELRYVYDPGDEGICRLTPKTQYALSSALAAALGADFGKSTSEQRRLDERADEELRDAMAVDGQSQTPHKRPDSRATKSRRRGYYSGRNMTPGDAFGTYGYEV